MASKWVKPDEDTPDSIPAWGYVGLPGEREWILSEYFQFIGIPGPVVLARFNEGPPTPEETRQIMERADDL